MIEKLREKNIKIQGSSKYKKKSLGIINQLLKTKYNYQFNWLGVSGYTISERHYYSSRTYF